MAEHPTYLWLNGKQTKWEDATVHVTSIGWSSVGAVFEGIRGYWNSEREELYIFRLTEHMDRFMRSMKLMRMEPKWDRDELIEAIVTLARDNDCRRDTYLRPLAYFGRLNRVPPSPDPSPVRGRGEFTCGTSICDQTPLSRARGRGRGRGAFRRCRPHGAVVRCIDA